MSEPDRGGPMPHPKKAKGAPIYSVPARDMLAVEHPMLVMNVDKALESFGKQTLPQHVRTGDQPRSRSATD